MTRPKSSSQKGSTWSRTRSTMFASSTTVRAVKPCWPDFDVPLLANQVRRDTWRWVQFTPPEPVSNSPSLSTGADLLVGLMKVSWHATQLTFSSSFTKSSQNTSIKSCLSIPTRFSLQIPLVSCLWLEATDVSVMEGIRLHGPKGRSVHSRARSAVVGRKLQIQALQLYHDHEPQKIGKSLYVCANP